VAPIVGAILGAWAYDVFVNKHHVAPEAGHRSSSTTEVRS
jgi:hypothetical protein